MKKVMIDTNVLLDLGLERDGHDDALGVVFACQEEGITMYMCATSTKDVFYWMAKAYGADEAYLQMARLLRFTRIATVDDIACKLGLGFERPDYEDGIVTACALAEQVDAIVTRDKKSFEGHSFAKYTPQEFVHALGYKEVPREWLS